MPDDVRWGCDGCKVIEKFGSVHLTFSIPGMPSRLPVLLMNSSKSTPCSANNCFAFSAARTWRSGVKPPGWLLSY